MKADPITEAIEIMNAERDRLRAENARLRDEVDAQRPCPNCAAPQKKAAEASAATNRINQAAIELHNARADAIADAEFDARCWTALAAFKHGPERFTEATRAIVAERPQITMVEFIERATKRRSL